MVLYHILKNGHGFISCPLFGVRIIQVVFLLLLLFNNIHNKLIKGFPKYCNIYAVDGSKFNVPRGFCKYGYVPRNDKATKNLAMISCIFNVSNNVPTNILLLIYFDFIII